VNICSDGSYCCDNDPNCCANHSGVILNNNGVAIGFANATLTSSTQSATSSATSSLSSVSNTASPSPSNHTDSVAIGLGVTLPIVALVALTAAFFFFRRRRQRAAANHEHYAPQYEPKEMMGDTTVANEKQAGAYDYSAGSAGSPPVEAPGDIGTPVNHVPVELPAGYAKPPDAPKLGPPGNVQ
jgi:hypothetical protein